MRLGVYFELLAGLTPVLVFTDMERYMLRARGLSLSFQFSKFALGLRYADTKLSKCLVGNLAFLEVEYRWAVKDPLEMLKDLIAETEAQMKANGEGPLL